MASALTHILGSEKKALRTRLVSKAFPLVGLFVCLSFARMDKLPTGFFIFTSDCVYVTLGITTNS